MENQLTHQQRQAFKRIELISLWEGRSNTTHLMKSLGLGRGTASTLINEYKELCANNLSYNNQNKGYEPTENFVAQYSSGLLDDYLSLELINAATVQRLGSSHQHPNPAHVRPIIQAIQRQQRLDIRYASLTNPEGEERIISPHTLINDGHRWHVRAWCEKSDDYRDFVLSRIRNVFGYEGAAARSREQDERWNTQVEFSIEPDQRFSEAQKKLIALDYGMTLNTQGKYQCHYQVRGALVMYWFQHLRIDRYRESPEAQQIILSPESRIAVQPWLPT